MTAAAVARTPASAFVWRLVGPIGRPEADAAILGEFSEFRGRILYAGGRRPSFRRDDGRYFDDDPLDSRSFHITVRAGGDLVGYTRIRPIPEYSQSTLGWLVARPEFERVLDGRQLIQHDCMEVSRWIVAPSARGTPVAPALVVSAWAVGRWLGKRSLIATVGSRDGQATLLARYGGQVLRSIAAKFVAEYDDQLLAMHFDLTSPPTRVAAKLRAMENLLRLGELPLEVREPERVRNLAFGERAV
jgi:hypothetical protein